MEKKDYQTFNSQKKSREKEQRSKNGDCSFG